MNGKHHRIVGTVVGRHDKLGIPQLRVEAWDADMLSRDDWLGEAVTAADGSFEIAFAQAQYAELFEGEPEIYFRVYAGQHLAEDLVCDVNAVPDSDDDRVRISIQLPAPSASDVTRQRSAFASHLEALARRCHPDNPRKFLSSLGQIFTTAGNTPFTTSRAPSCDYPAAHTGAHVHSAAHACLSGAVAEVMSHLFPREANTYASLANEAGESRLWVGIHFRSDITAGHELGRQVGQAVVERAKQDGAQYV